MQPDLSTQGDMGQNGGRNGAEPDFRSADSVPEGYAVSRPLWLTPVFLATVALTSVLVIENMDAISRAYKDVLATINSLPNSASLGLGSLGFRPFFALVIVLVGMFSGGPLLGRLRFTLIAAAAYVVGVLAADSIYLRLQSIGTPPPFSAAGNVTAGFIGVLVMAAGVFTLYHLPSDTVVHREVRRGQKRFFFVLFLSMVAGAVALIFAFTFGAEFLDQLREVALLGGLGPGLALFLPTVFLTLFFIGWAGISYGRVRRWLRRGSASQRPQPEVAFLVAAYNEEAQIRDCIRALDAAASKYRGTARLYIVDNGSEDATVAIAERAISRCDTLDETAAQVLHCPIKGKSHALNFGLEHITEEIVVRVDADTIVEPSLLEKSIPYFEDPAVGGVTGMPLPKKRLSLMGLLRTIEVYYNVGFNRVAQAAIDAVMVLPGIMSAYRRDALVRLGGFAQGINGEDTDMSVRIGRLGYRLLVDPSIHMHTEVPSSFAHLREQRLRWSRSLYHVASRNMSAIRMRQGTRGLWVLSWAAYYSSRRLVVLPIIIYALVLLAYDPQNPALRQGAAIAAIMIGPQVFVLALTLLLYGKLSYILLIPPFLVFRLLRSYFAMESFFTLPASPVKAPKPAAQPTPVMAPSGAADFLQPAWAAAGEVATPPADYDGVNGTNGHQVYAGQPAGHDDAWQLPSNHPIRRVKLLTDHTVDWLSPVLERMQRGERETEVDPALTVRAAALMAVHDIDDEAEFCAEASHNRVSAWFMQLEPGMLELDAGALRTSRQELLSYEVARESLDVIARDARRRGLYPGSPLLQGSPVSASHRRGAAAWSSRNAW